MTPEELLKPRFELIADYPNNNSPIGRIFGHNVDGTQNVMPLDEWLTWHNQYPAIFKKMEWLEDRKPEDMPEYVKDDDGVYKVQEWHTELAPKVTVFIIDGVHEGYREGCEYTPLYSEILPATKEEYSSYINSKTPPQ